MAQLALEFLVGMESERLSRSPLQGIWQRGSIRGFSGYK